MNNKKALLFDEEEQEPEELQINKIFASKYDYNQKRKHIENLEQKYGKDAAAEPEGDDDYDESEDESDDSDAVLLTNKAERKYMELIARIKSNDKTLHEGDADYFKESDFEESEDDNRGTKQGKKVTYRDVIRRDALLQINKLDDGGSAEDEDSSDGGNTKSIFTKKSGQETIAEE